jgi:hypothetical protein
VQERTPKGRPPLIYRVGRGAGRYATVALDRRICRLTDRRDRGVCRTKRRHVSSFTRNPTVEYESSDASNALSPQRPSRVRRSLVRVENARSHDRRVFRNVDRCLLASVTARRRGAHCTAPTDADVTRLSHERARVRRTAPTQRA